MATKRPRVFVGSSRESLGVANAVSRALATVAEVTVWDVEEQYQRPGTYFLEALVDAPKSHDFAVMVFGRDDELTIRGEKMMAPRDNVVFELGLFWSYLGRERVSLMVPRRGEEVRVLTDLQALTPYRFDAATAATDPDAAVASACEQIRRSIVSHGPFQLDRGPRGASSVGEPLAQLMRDARARGEPVVVHNVALDMGSTWATLVNGILGDDSVEDVTWRTLMLDPASEAMRDLWSSTVSQKQAALVRETMLSYCGEHRDALAQRRIVFECRAYAGPPCVHGFLFNDRNAFLSMCRIEKGKLVGDPTPYLCLDAGADSSRSRAANHLVAAFGSWFEQAWQHGSSPIWPEQGSP